MLRLLADIPDYDEELKRLANNESLDLSGALRRFLNNLFDFNVDPLVFEVFKILAYVVVAVSVFWFIYKEFQLNSFTFEETNNDVVPKGGLGTAADADIRGHRFEKELKDALAKGDYAEAVRLRYLFTLQQLNEMKIIQWKEWKTPLMYVDELDYNAETLKELTMSFLYIKYGHYPATEETYDNATGLSNSLVVNEKGGEV